MRNRSTNTLTRSVGRAGLATLVAATSLAYPVFTSGNAGAVGLSTAVKMAGVRNIQYGTSAAAAPHLGAYGLNVGTAFEMAGFCVEHAGAAPNPAPGAYNAVSNPAVENDPILAPAVNWFQWVRLFGPSTVGQDGVAIQGAALATVAHYRAAMIGLPGETAYPSGIGAPTGPASFLITDGGGPTMVYGNVDIGSTTGAAVENQAWLYWNQFGNQPGPYSTQTSILQGQTNPAGYVTAEVTIRASNGNIASGFFQQTDFAATNGSAIEWSYDPAFGTIIPGGTAVGLTSAPAYARWTAVDPTQATAIVGNITTIASSAIYLEPTNPAEQNMVAAGLMQALPTGASAPAAPPSDTAIRVTKVNDNPNFQGTAGIVFNITDDSNGAPLGTLTTDGNGNTNVVTINAPFPANIRITEDAASANATGHVPAGPWIVPVDPTGNTDIAVTATNLVVQRALLQIDKLDINTGDRLAGAGFTVRRDGNNDAAFGSDPVAGPYVFGPGADGIWGNADDVRPASLAVDGVIPGPGLDGAYNTADDDGLWYSLPDRVVTVGPVWAGSYQVVETTPPAGYELSTNDNTQVVPVGHSETKVVSFGNFKTMSVVTKATKAGGNVGDKYADTITIVNGDIEPKGTVVTAELFGPFPTVAAMVCTGTPVATDELTVFGQAPVVSPEHAVTKEGWYTYMVTAESEDGRVATHACGDLNESFRVVDVRTKAKAATVKAGDLVSDITIVKGLAAGEQATVIGQLYGPFADGVTATCTAATLVGTVNFTVTGSGETESPKLTAPTVGNYTWVETLNIPGGGTATHPCGVPAETFRAVNITTKVENQFVAVGGTTADTAIVTGLKADEKATVVAELFGPFATAADIKCEAGVKVTEVTYEVKGNGEFLSPRITVAAPGVYTFVETLKLADGTAITHACGDKAETFTTVGLATKASSKTVEVGSGVADIAIVTGLAGDQKATVDVALYGPFATAADIKCEDSVKVGTTSYTIMGSGEHPSPALLVSTAGVYTFVETLTTDSGVKVTHKCGEEAETFTAFVRPRNPGSGNGGGGAGGGGGSLAQTGTNPAGLILFSLSLVLFGTLARASSRKRRNKGGAFVEL